MPTNRLTRRFGAGVMAIVMAGATVLVVAPSVALAGTAMAIAPNIPGSGASVTVGATGVSSYFTITSLADGNQATGVIRVTNATITTALGVFTLYAGTGNAGSLSCAGSTWNISHVDGATTTTWTFAPTTNVDLTSLGANATRASCRVDFTVDVLKVPSPDPTQSDAAVSGFWDPGQLDQLPASGTGSGSTTINPATPLLSTTASGPVTVGSTIHDVAHLSGGVGTITGSILFQVFAPTDTTCSTPLTPALASVPVSQTAPGSTDYTSPDFTTAVTGTYLWEATFTDTDGNNSSISHTACGATGESSLVVEPLVQVTKTANPVGPVTAGNPIGFDITVANIGTILASGVSLNDPLPTTPAGIGTWTITSGPTGTGVTAPSCSINSNTLSCVAVDLPVSASYTLHVSAPTATTTSGTATNTATITSTNGNCVSGNNDSRCSATATVTIKPVVTGEILPTNTECSDFVNNTTPALAGIFYSVSGNSGKIGQNINPGVFFYYTYVTTTVPNQAVTTSQHATNGASLFTLNQGHAWLYTAACGLVSNSPTLVGTPTGSAASFTIATPGTYVLRLQYSTKSIAGTAAPSPAGSVYTFDINGTDNASVPLIKQ